MPNQTKKTGLILLIVLAFILPSKNVFATNANSVEIAAAQAEEKKPEFPGGDQALMKFLDENIKYPPQALKQGIQGRVSVQFIVKKSGSIKKVKVLESINPALDEEAVRVVKAMPNWIPAEKNGKKKSMEYTLPINFSLEKKENKKVVITTQTFTKQPEFTGGSALMFLYIQENLKKIEQSINRNFEGQVVAQFVVNTIGKIENVKITEGIDSEVDEKIKNMIETMPNWIPGERNGKKVNSDYTLPLTLSFKNSKQELTGVSRVHTVVDKKPQFPGGNSALKEFIAKNMQYPSEARQKKEEGRVFVDFIVDKSGKITEISVIRGVSASLDKEAARLVQIMPNWTPGELRGKIVDTKYTLPIDFKL